MDRQLITVDRFEGDRGAPGAHIDAFDGTHAGIIGVARSESGEGEGVSVGFNKVCNVVVQAYLPCGGSATLGPSQRGDGAVARGERDCQRFGLLKKLISSEGDGITPLTHLTSIDCTHAGAVGGAGREIAY